MNPMKRILPLLIALLTIACATAQDAKLGDEAYRKGDYAAAIDQYEAVLASGRTSADLHYNLGNAYYREGQMANAILNYHRALRLKPSMNDAKENLALAESHTTDRITPLPQLFLSRWLKDLRDGITPTAWRGIWLALLAVLGVCIVLFRIGRTVGQQKVGFVGGIVSLVLIAEATYFLIVSTSHYNAHSEAIVMEPAISIKGSPEQQSVDKMLLHEGTMVVIEEELSSWYKIRIADGTTGWCESQSVERI